MNERRRWDSLLEERNLLEERRGVLQPLGVMEELQPTSEVLVKFASKMRVLNRNPVIHWSDRWVIFSTDGLPSKEYIKKKKRELARMCIPLMVQCSSTRAVMYLNAEEAIWSESSINVMEVIDQIKLESYID